MSTGESLAQVVDADTAHSVILNIRVAAGLFAFTIDTGHTGDRIVATAFVLSPLGDGVFKQADGTTT